MKITIKTRDRNITATATDANGKFLAEAYGTYFSGDNVFHSRTIGAAVSATLRYERVENGKARWVEVERVKISRSGATTRARHDKLWRKWFREEGRAKLTSLAAGVISYTEAERGLFAATTGG